MKSLFAEPTPSSSSSSSAAPSLMDMLGGGGGVADFGAFLSSMQGGAPVTPVTAAPTQLTLAPPARTPTLPTHDDELD